MNKVQKILIQHHQIQLPPADRGTLSTQVLATLMTNISYFGYALSLRAFEHLSTCLEDDIYRWWEDVKPVFRALTGDDRSMADFVVYKNFPKEVLEMSEAEYWTRQIFMYWGFPNEMFTQPVEERAKLSEELTLRTLHPASEGSLEDIYLSLLHLPNRWTEGQIEDVLFLALEVPGKTDLSQVPFKENMAQLAAHLLKHERDVMVRAATDVLRLAAAMSDGDTSLRTAFKFRKFSRKERKFLLNILEHTGQLEEDMVCRTELWKRLMVALHPGDYPARFPRVVAAYDKLYNDTLPATFASQLEGFLEARDEQALALLKSRPGEFVRRLHACILLFGEAAARAFLDVIDKLQTIQLLKMQRYLETINTRSFRTYAPKGNWTKMQIASNESSRQIPEAIQEMLLKGIATQLKERLQPMIPSVALDENTEWIKLQTNDSDLTPYGRGTVFPIPPNIRFLRTASYWKINPALGYIWFDNGWNFFDQHWNAMGACCWNLYSFGDNAAIFSGDPTNSKDMEGRACQMIDLYPEKLLKEGVRYAVWNILCYSRIAFDKADDVFAALQWGEHPEEGKLFEPSRCQMSFPLKGENFTKYIAMIDLKERQLIYLDANLRASVQSAGVNSGILAQAMPAFLQYLESIPTAFDLFKHLPRANDGLPVLYTDREQTLEGQQAYVFRPENQHSTFKPVALSEIMAGAFSFEPDSDSVV